MDNVNDRLYWCESDTTLNNISKLMRADINSMNEELVLNVPGNKIDEIYALKDSNLIIFRIEDKFFNNSNGYINYIFQESGMLTSCIDEDNNFIYTFDEHPNNPLQFSLIRWDLDGSNPNYSLSNPPWNANYKPQSSFFDKVNNRIYYTTPGYIMCYDVASDSHYSIFNLWIHLIIITIHIL